MTSPSTSLAADTAAHDPATRENVPTTKEPSHFRYIDALRGWAFLIVLVTHTQGEGNFHGKRMLFNANYGVQLFFLLSAITLCYSMSSRKRVDRFPVFFFYLRRLFRIAPMFWVAIVFYGSPFHTLGRGGIWQPLHFTIENYLMSAFFLYGWNPNTFNLIVPGSWSIAVEMNFYLLFPFIYRFAGTRSKRAMLCVLAGLLYGWQIPRLFLYLHDYYFKSISTQGWYFFATYSLPLQLPYFFIGILTYHMLRETPITKLVRDPFWASSILGFVALIGVSILRGFATGLIQGPAFMVLSLAAVVLATSGNVPKMIVNRATCYLGKISYSAYLTHFALLGIAKSILGPPKTLDSSLGNFILFVKLSAITLAMTVVIATITFHLIEEPGKRLGSKVLAAIERYAAKRETRKLAAS